LSDHHQSRLTILLVEDEFLVRMTIAEFLRASDCEVIEAASGEAAVEVLQERDGIDVVFTDVRLGGELNGWDVGEVSRATHPAIPVIYTSGAVIVPERPVEGSVFFEKPYEPNVVLSACQRLHQQQQAFALSA
jgi:CheY-like chemotaxis protein